MKMTVVFGRTPPGVRELKPSELYGTENLALRRTPPGVRELKPLRCLRRVRTH